MKKDLCKQGFTLIELMVVTVILTVIGMTVYGTFANGINIWKRVTEESADEELALFFEKMSYDLRNTFKMTGLRFQGERQEMRFPVRMKMVEDREMVNTIGQVRYAFDRRKKTLNRSVANYSEVYLKKPGEDRVLAENIHSLDLRYFIYNEKEKKYYWENHWQDEDNAFGIVTEEQIPLVVRVEVGVKEDQKVRAIVKTIPLPSACCWPFEDESHE